MWTDAYSNISSGFEDLETLQEFYELGEVEEEEINAEYAKVRDKVEELEFKKMLSGEEDQLGAMLEINPGAGGTESQDWSLLPER